MPQKSAPPAKPKRTAGVAENAHEQKGRAGRPEAEARAWASADKFNGAGKKIATGRKVPSGPVGGSGRKTNLARSS